MHVISTIVCKILDYFILEITISIAKSPNLISFKIYLLYGMQLRIFVIQPFLI